VLLAVDVSVVLPEDAVFPLGGVDVSVVVPVEVPVVLPDVLVVVGGVMTLVAGAGPPPPPPPPHAAKVNRLAAADSRATLLNVLITPIPQFERKMPRCLLERNRWGTVPSKNKIRTRS